MESAALFVVASALHVRVGTVLLALANQERAKAGLANEQVHNTEHEIEVAVEAMKALIAQDKNKKYGKNSQAGAGASIAASGRSEHS